MKTIKVKNINYRNAFSMSYDSFINPHFVYALDPTAIFFGDRDNDILKRATKPYLAYCDYCFKVLL